MTDDGDLIAFGILLFAGIAGAIIGGLLAWFYAPPVGGEWWPYIRAFVVILAVGIGGKIAMLLSVLGLYLLLGVLVVLDGVVSR